MPFLLVVVGLGPERMALRRLARRLGLRGRVRFVPRVPHENMPDVYGRADIFVAPGRRTPQGDVDGLPSALVEALASGLAVVVSDLPGQLEAVRQGENGLVTPQEDVEALAGALETLAASEEERRRLGRAARQALPALLDGEATEARFVQLFKSACAVQR